MPVHSAPDAPFLGRLGAYRSDRLAFFAACADEGGAAVPCRLTGDGFLLNEPGDIRHVLVGNGSNYVKSRRVTGPRAQYPRPDSLLTSAGAEHRRKRRAMQGAFRRSLVERLVERARANSDRLAASWVEGAEVDVAHAMTALAQRNILETLLAPATEPLLAQLVAAGGARRLAFERLLFSPFPLTEYIPSRTNRQHLRATWRLRRAIAAEIEARRRAVERPDDLLSMLMDATYDDGSPLSDREVRDEVMMISLTGYDSVSEALAWTLYLLARNPQADAAVAGEARAARGHGSPPALPYATSVVKESLRLFPPTWMFVRVARGDDRLPSGAAIRVGAKVYLCPYVVHRNPRYWSEPDRFQPERFARDERSSRPRYAYFPFGGGPHVCIGEALALAQILTILAAVTSRHRLTLAPSQAVVPEGGLSLRPKGGLRMRVEARTA